MVKQISPQWTLEEVRAVYRLHAKLISFFGIAAGIARSAGDMKSGRVQKSASTSCPSQQRSACSAGTCDHAPLQRLQVTRIECDAPQPCFLVGGSALVSE